MVHANLDHGVIRVDRHPRQGKRHAPVIVVTLLRGVDLGLGCQHRAQHLLGRGLADRAGDGDDFGLRAGPGRGAQGTQCVQGIAHDQ